MKAGQNVTVLVLLMSLRAFGGVGVPASSSLGNKKQPLQRHRPRSCVGGRGRFDTSTSWAKRKVSASVTRRTAIRLRGGAPVSDQYNARMQVMITRNMRKVLVDELDYLPEEVDDMDPQIAAVVIEKSLPRPRAGMPIAWRRSIRHTGGSPNPLRYLTGAVQSALESVLNGVVTVVAFPFVAAGKGIGAVRERGVKGTVATVVVLGLAATALTSRRAGEDANDAYQEASGLRLWGNNLAAARSRLSRRGGGGRRSSNDVPSGARESRRGPNKPGTPAVTTGGRWFGAEDKRPQRQGPKDTVSSEDRRRSAGGNIRDFSPSRKSGVEGEDRGNNWGDQGVKNTSSSQSSTKDLPKLSSTIPQKRKAAEHGGRAAAGGVPGEERSPERSSTALENRGSEMRREGSTIVGTGSSRSSDDGGRPQLPSEPAKFERQKGVASNAAGEDDEVCPDAPVSPNASGAVWFEELPPAPPAPETIGVLDEDDDVAALADPERAPRWGRKPMTEHIPSEEEMDAWDSKIEASDTWLDRGINRVMGALFGGGGGGR